MLARLKEKITSDRIAVPAQLMMLLGFLLAAASESATVAYQSSSPGASSPYPWSWALSLASKLGTGLIAAGILALSLQRVDRQRHRQNIAEIKGAHSEAILRQLMPEEIFAEVQNHIIRQPFLRTKYQLTLDLTWVKDSQGKDHILKSQTLSYEVENISRTLENYALYLWEEKGREKGFPHSTSIDRVEVQSETECEVYEGTSLAPYLKADSQHVFALIPIRLEPGQKLSIASKVKSILLDRENYAYSATKPTIGMDCTISHPKDLRVTAVPLHPSQHSFAQTVNEPTLKRWKIEAGILPFQGIQLNWEREAGEE